MPKKRDHNVVKIEVPVSSIVTHRRQKQKTHKDKLDNRAFQRSQMLLKAGKTKKRIEEDPLVKELSMMLGLQKNNINTVVIEESDPRKCRPKYHTNNGRGKGGRFANV